MIRSFLWFWWFCLLYRKLLLFRTVCWWIIQSTDRIIDCFSLLGCFGATLRNSQCLLSKSFMSQSEELTSSLNISTESTSLQAASVQGGVMEAETGSQRSQSRSSSNAFQSRPRRVRQGSQSKTSVRAIVKALPRVGSSSSSQPIGPTIELHRHETQQLYDGRTQEVHIHDQRTVSQEVHLHDGRTQSVHFGVSPQEFGMVVSEAQRLLDESQQKANAMSFRVFAGWVLCSAATVASGLSVCCHGHVCFHQTRRW